MKGQDVSPSEVAFAALRTAIGAGNDFYSAGVESARCEAAETIIDSPIATLEDKDVALRALIAIAKGEHSSSGIVNRVRAAKAILKHIADPSAMLKTSKTEKKAKAAT